MPGPVRPPAAGAALAQTVIRIDESDGTFAMAAPDRLTMVGNYDADADGNEA